LVCNHNLYAAVTCATFVYRSSFLMVGPEIKEQRNMLLPWRVTLLALLWMGLHDFGPDASRRMTK